MNKKIESSFSNACLFSKNRFVIAAIFFEIIKNVLLTSFYQRIKSNRLVNFLISLMIAGKTESVVSSILKSKH